MWKCAKCQERVEDSFEVCWNCGTSKDGIEDPAFRRAAEREAEALDTIGSTEAEAVQSDEPQENLNPITCARCQQNLDYVGTKRFHEGTNWGVLGELGELFLNREHFDVYVCPRCGRVEFFVDGVGEEYRPH